MPHVGRDAWGAQREQRLSGFSGGRVERGVVVNCRRSWLFGILVLLAVMTAETPAYANYYGGNFHETGYGTKADISWTGSVPSTSHAAWVSTPAYYDPALGAWSWYIQTGFHGNTGSNPNSYVEYHYSNGKYSRMEMSTAPPDWARTYEVHRISARYWGAYVNGSYKVAGYIANDNRQQLQAMAESWNSYVGDVHTSFRNVKYQYSTSGAFYLFDQYHFLQQGGWSVSYDNYGNYDSFGDD